ncbi:MULTISPECIES: AAA family ATPase [unclassified Sphingomonas]|uniref:AAA family ATPase n=1 Tax=unclassified Sphingomonas TaxID=196159 RepID=UPI0006F43F2F|nr:MULTISPECIES: AAA family ATPase [unclassified Sphingomonas]KQX19962.1 DNA polymerase [Sphingomonas sp. Root1294]KQY67209.1 DNA polymerase [Sphingomonas sp. Root50]KRB90582.1 DNA polymerase [Sphingomonas sp. Root720]
MSLVGHDEQIAAFREAADTGRLHHAWLLTGPEGVGKASFALMAATRLLANAAGPRVDLPGIETPEGHPIVNYIRAGSHPDIRILARLTKDKSDDLARSISIEQVRSLQGLFATTPSLSPRRVVIIDAIDDLERPAANALLKNLEEPPAGTTFFLVSHAPGRLLPTIRSRCRQLRFAPLTDPEMRLALQRALPEEPAGEIDALIGVGNGSPGRALGFAGLEIAALDMAMDRLVEQGDPTNAIRAALSRQLGTKAAQPRYEAYLERVPARIVAEARRRQGPSLAEAIALWEAARRIGESAVHLSLDPSTTVFELATMLAKLAPAPTR